MKQERDTAVDIVAGFFVIVVILKHVHYETNYLPGFMVWIERLFYFTMPWFFFKAGSYFRLKKRDEYFRQSTKQLLKPFIVFSILGILVSLPFKLGKDSFEFTLTDYFYSLWQYGSFPENVPAWFLLTLFLVRLLANEIERLRINRLLVAIIGLLVGYLLHFKVYDYPYWIANTALGLAFFFTGLWWSAPTIQHQPFIQKYKLWMIYLPALGLFGLHQILELGTTIILDNKILNAKLAYDFDYIIWFVASTAGCILVNKVAELKILRHTGLHRAGQYSKSALVLHPIIIFLMLSIAYALYDCVTPSPKLFFGIVFTNILLIPLFHYIFRRLRLL